MLCGLLILVDCIDCCLVLGVFDRFVDCWFWVGVVGWYCLFVFRSARMWVVIVLQGFGGCCVGLLIVLWSMPLHFHCLLILCGGLV